MRVERLSYCLITAAVAGLFLSACHQQPAAMPQQAQEVGVITAKVSAVPVVTELPGRTDAYQVAQVRARVDGIVLRREFVEGSEVKAGQRLYKIDPAPYIAALNSAKATLQKAQANLVAQNALAARYKVLVAANAISKQDYDNAVATQGQAAADVAAGKAAVDTAQINLGYTDVISPISGRVGISQVTPGAYVQASAATLMSTVQQLDPMYVDLTQSSLDGLKLRRDAESGRLQVSGPNAAKVELVLEDGRTYAETGKLQFSDVTVDESTGSVTVRALFPNPKGVLLPGMFVRARIEEGVDPDAILVPVIGVQHNQKGDAIVLVVGADDKVQEKVIKTAGTQGQDWIVEGGLNPGDRVIVQGGDKVQPGATVKPVPAQLPPQPAPGAPSADESNGESASAPASAAGASSASAAQ